MDRPCHALFLCTGNSARSILAESLINHCGGGLFRGLGAGSHPKHAVRPVASLDRLTLHLRATGPRAFRLYEAITHVTDGVLPWIKARW